MKRNSLIAYLMAVASLTSAAGEFPKAILPGDYPDPSILRDGEDYYMTHSPFYYAPGFLIWHSRDLQNWEPICRALPDYKGSAMAPDLVKFGDRYYIYYPAAGTNWVTWADDIRGPWSEPVDLKVSGIDPGQVADAEGNRYLYVNEGEVIALTPDGLATIGEKKDVYDGWQYPKQWKTEGMYLESPKLTYHNGYYYLTSAQGGTAGPATSHMVASARSRNIDGPWEDSPYNPIVHTYSADDKWWSKGHGTIVDDTDGNWWVVYHAYRNGYHTLGRSTLIEPIEWTSDGWFRAVPDGKFLQVADSTDHGIDLSDSFDGNQLGMQWTFWGENGLDALSFSNQGLTIKGKGKSPVDSRLLLTTPTHANYTVQVEVTPDKRSTAGLLLYYNDKAFAGVTSDGKNLNIYHSADSVVTIPSKYGQHFFAKLHNRANTLSISASSDGRTWETIASGIDVSQFHHNNYGGFYALRPALSVSGKGKAQFRNFEYADAVPTESDMGAYLMVFHLDDTHGLHMALSRDGYTFTALNGGKPVISGDTIADQKGIRDPHIFRGPDGAFYLAMTDLHIFAQKAGYRDTEWERDGKKYGWGNNRGLVLMKSFDLVNWNRTNLHIDEISKEFSEIGCAWAPETTYDEESGRLMLYFTMRFGNEANRLYYAYVDDDFTHLTSRPVPLFEYPDGKTTAIDGDITRVGDRYHLFYVAHEGTPGIKQAISDKIGGEYAFSPKWIDPEPNACEAPTVWKRIGEDRWVLMYDCYGIEKHNFGFMETSDFETFTPIGRFNEGPMKAVGFSSPKHGAVVHLTSEEADFIEKALK